MSERLLVVVVLLLLLTFAIYPRLTGVLSRVLPHSMCSRPFLEIYTFLYVLLVEVLPSLRLVLVSPWSGVAFVATLLELLSVR